jgi:EmrB/QacA subfamily drug resistance transporter
VRIAHDGPASTDPRRWITLAIVLLSTIIIVIDNTVLTVAIPTILRDFHTELPSLQWVLTGYSLTFATFLIIGGRLGDIYGARRTFIAGATLFGIGSYLASESSSVPSLLLGESLIEGIGASLMMPATLSILSTTFTGSERSRAFAAWGATAGAAVAFGPLLGGYLTTSYSWRWSFRINLFVAPLAVIGALLFMRASAPAARRQRIDVVGAVLIATGTFLLVFGLSEGSAYGWFQPTRALTVLGWTAWPATRAISAIPIVFVLALAVLTGFIVWERTRERTGRDPLFQLGLLRHLGFRYGLLTTAVLAMGQLGFLFVLPVVLQDGKHLSAQESGLWLVPSGLFIVLGAQLGGRIARRVNTTVVVRAGLVLEMLGLCAIAIAMTPHLTFPQLLPGFALFGVGLGFASSQLTNVVLSEIPAESAGAASGANTTVRQIGSALGIAVIGSLLTTQTAHALGSGHPIEVALPDAARPALLFAAAVVTVGTCLSFLIPMLAPAADDAAALAGVGTIDPVEALEVFDGVERA